MPGMSSLFAGFLAMAGCAAGPGRRDPVARALRGADQQYETASDADSRGAALDGYRAILRTNPDDPRVLGTLTRALVIEGMADPERARESWQAAREYGLRCLLAGAGFASVVSGAGGRVTPAAAKQVLPGHAACATWTAEAWARQAAERGGGGVALDLAAIQALAAKGVEARGPTGDSAHAKATLGLALALTPDPLRRSGERDERERARAALQAAIDLAPSRLLPRVDLAQFVLLPAGESEAGRQLLEDVLAQPAEAGAPPGDEWARQRAETLLETL